MLKATLNNDAQVNVANKQKISFCIALKRFVFPFCLGPHRITTASKSFHQAVVCRRLLRSRPGKIYLDKAAYIFSPYPSIYCLEFPFTWLLFILVIRTSWSRPGNSSLPCQAMRRLNWQSLRI